MRSSAPDLATGIWCVRHFTMEVHFVCNNGCNLFHTVSAMIFCPAAVGWI